MNLTPLNKLFFTAEDLANTYKFKQSFASKLLDFSTAFSNLRKFYIARCPNCGDVLLVSRHLDMILGQSLECAGSHDNKVLFTVKREDIEIVYGIKQEVEKTYAK